MGKASGAEGWELFWYTIGGAAVGTIAMGVGALTFSNIMNAGTAAGMSTFYAGMHAGIISGMVSGAISGGLTASIRGGSIGGI